MIRADVARDELVPRWPVLIAPLPVWVTLNRASVVSGVSRRAPRSRRPSPSTGGSRRARDRGPRAGPSRQPRTPRATPRPSPDRRSGPSRGPGCTPRRRARPRAGSRVIGRNRTRRAWGRGAGPSNAREQRLAELEPPQPRVEPVLCEQLVVAAQLHEPAVVEDRDPVRRADRRQPVRDDDRRPALISRSSASWTSRSDSLSRALVASSSSRIGGSLRIARAIAIRCRCPPESRVPAVARRASRSPAGAR